MDIQFNKISPNHGIISITLPESSYKLTVEKQIKHYAQHVRLKGFRLGAVPVSLVRSMYGRSILSEELNKIASASLKNYIAQERIPVFIEPILVSSPPNLDLDDQRTFTFSYEIGLMGECPVELGPHMSVTEFEIDRVECKLIDEFLEGLRIVHGQMLHLEESTEDAMLYGSFKDGTGSVSLKIRISVAHIPEHLRKSFIGLRVGTKVTLTEEMLANHFAALLGIDFGAFAYLKRHKTAWPASFIIDKIAHVTLAPVDVALFDLVLGKGVADSESSFRDAIAKIILFDKRTEARYAFHEDLRDEIFKHTSVDLPGSFLKKWLFINNPGAKLEEIEGYYSAHKEDLRWELLLGNIVNKNGLAVTQSDVVDEARRAYVDSVKNNSNSVGTEFNDAHMEAEIQSFLTKDKGKHYTQLHEQLSRDKAINFIKENISVVRETVTAEQFDARK